MKILVFGGSGLVGSRFVSLFSKQFEIIAPSHSEVDLLNLGQIKKNIQEVKPDQILYAAAYTNVDKAEEESGVCYKLNTDAVKIVAVEAKDLNIPLHYLSTDYVFDGTKVNEPYSEDDKPNPLSVYARSKYEGEIAVLESNSINSILRIIMPFSAVFEKKSDIVRTFLSKLKSNEKIAAISDQKINPIFVDDLASAIALILEKQRSGIYHLGATTFTTPLKFASLIADKFNLDKSLITAMSFEEFSNARAALRPQFSWLDAAKFRKEFGEGILHSIEDELEEFKKLFKV